MLSWTFVVIGFGTELGAWLRNEKSFASTRTSQDSSNAFRNSSLRGWLALLRFEFLNVANIF